MDYKFVWNWDYSYAMYLVLHKGISEISKVKRERERKPERIKKPNQNKTNYMQSTGDLLKL